MILANTYTHEGDHDEALAHLHAALAAAREAGDRNFEGDVVRSIGLAHLERRDPAAARAPLHEAAAISREVGNRGAEGYALGILGIAGVRLGDDDAQRHLEAATAIAREGEDVGAEGQWRGHLALMLARRGDPEAWQRLDEAVALLEGKGSVFIAAELLLDGAELAYARDDADRARTFLRRFVACTERGAVALPYRERADALARRLAATR